MNLLSCTVVAGPGYNLRDLSVSGKSMRFCGSRSGLLVVLILGLSACEGVSSGHTSSKAPSPAVSVAVSADPQRCARLAQRGFTPCPPTPDRMQLPPTTIRNATNGAISDATAQQWGRAFQLTEAYYRWAMQNGARSALTSGILADSSLQAVGNLFGTDLQDLDTAKQVGGMLTYQPPQLPTVAVISMSSAVQELIRGQGLVPSPWGLVVRFTGPTRRTIRSPDGRETEVAARDATFVVDVAIWGELRADIDLGLVWFEHGYYSCDGSIRAVCQS